jgi:hypothetical protein
LFPTRLKAGLKRWLFPRPLHPIHLAVEMRSHPLFLRQIVQRQIFPRQLSLLKMFLHKIVQHQLRQLK